MITENQKKHIIKLKQKKYRNEFAEFTLEGIKGVEVALEADADVRAVLIEEARKEEPAIAEIISHATKKDIEIVMLAQKDIGTVKATDHFPGVMAVIEKPEDTLEDFDLEAPVICLDQVTDPGNLGTIIRTADWFGFTNILLSEGCVDAYNDKCVRSTMGSIFHVTIVKSGKISQSIKNLKEMGYVATGLVLDGTDMKQTLPEKKNVYIFGSESHGIREEVKTILDKRLRIPGKGNAESLNVAISAGVVMGNIGER